VAIAHAPRLDVVIVTWNHNRAVERCLTALARAASGHYQLDRLVVVDNASRPAYRATPVAGLPSVTVLTNARNRGFAAACNQGASGSKAEYLLFLNPDAEVGSDTIAAVLRHLEEDDHTAIAGPPLEDAHGVRQATCGRFLSAANVLTQTSGLSRLGPTWFSGTRMSEWDHRDTRLVDYVSGACLFVRRSVFEQLDGFDERLTVYLEDVDLSLRARQRGWDTCFVSTDPVAHVGGWSAGRDRGWRLAHAWRSLIVYGRKHLGGVDATLVLLTVLIVAPAARLGQAAVHRSLNEALTACSGYLTLWRLLARDLVSPAR
jgi:GT2 family glycosyltransferase